MKTKNLTKNAQDAIIFANNVVAQVAKDGDCLGDMELNALFAYVSFGGEVEALSKLLKRGAPTSRIKELIESVEVTLDAFMARLSDTEVKIHELLNLLFSSWTVVKRTTVAL
jgi:hypothetical protein